MVAFELLNSLNEELEEEVFEDELSWSAWILQRLLLRILSELLVIWLKRSLVVLLEKSIDDVVKLLELSTESTKELLATLVAAMDVEQL